jgi:hypothetical protein
LAKVANAHIERHERSIAIGLLQQAERIAQRIVDRQDRAKQMAGIAMGFARVQLFFNARRASEQCSAVDRLEVYATILNASH